MEAFLRLLLSKVATSISGGNLEGKKKKVLLKRMHMFILQ